MVNKKLVIFDLDGTLLDTSEGIMHCYDSTGTALGLIRNELSYRKIVIGGPLSDGFNTLYKIPNKETLNTAIELYRKLYKESGIKMFSAYDGIEQLLKSLKDNGIYTATATLKLESFAREMLKSAGIAQYFDLIKGFNGDESCTKAYILNQVVNELGISKSDAVLIGDSKYDAVGAQSEGIDFIGVSYGFGIKEGGDNDAFKSIYIAKSPQDIKTFLLG